MTRSTLSRRPVRCGIMVRRLRVRRCVGAMTMRPPAKRNPPVGDWTAQLSDSDRQIADEIIARVGLSAFSRVAMAYASAPRKEGAAGLVNERRHMLLEVATLMVGPPGMSEMAAISATARKYAATPKHYGGGLVGRPAMRKWLIDNFETLREAMMITARRNQDSSLGLDRPLSPNWALSNLHEAVAASHGKVPDSLLALSSRLTGLATPFSEAVREAGARFSHLNVNIPLAQMGGALSALRALKLRRDE